MDIATIIDEFIYHAKSNSIEIYNEFALQFELSFYLREILAESYKIQLERNIVFLGLSRSDFVKKEMDIIIFKDEKDFKDICVIELKAIIDQEKARPRTVYNWINDIKFLEQLKDTGVGRCFSLFITDNENLVSNSKSSIHKSSLLPDFRKREIRGVYSTHAKPNKNNKTISLEKEYTFSWKEFSPSLKYFLVEV